MKNITLDGLDETSKIVENDGYKPETKKDEPDSKFNERNYLNVKLAPGETTKELRIRLLPIDKDAETPFKIVHMHNMQVSKDVSKSGWKQYVCLNPSLNPDVDHEAYGDKCPICEKRWDFYQQSKAAKEAGDNDKSLELSKKSLALRDLEVCIVRCIERGKESEGPKFWKFNLRKDGKDPYHVITGLVRTRRQEKIEAGIKPEDAGNILDLYTGRDLRVTITAVEGNSDNGGKTSVSVIDCGFDTPLSSDNKQIEAWVNDEKKWSEVFVTKPAEYLALIVENKTPFFDKNKGIWVEKIENYKELKRQQADNIVAEAEREANSPEEEEYLASIADAHARDMF